MPTDAHPIEHQAIIGRDREREQLRSLLDDTISSRGRLVLISGEAGIGKTTLVRDLKLEATERACLVLSGGCYDLTTTPPYGPWSEAIRSYRPTDGQPSVPAWFSDPQELAEITSQAALFEDARRFFTAVSAQQPLLIVLEDLHWADPASLEALRYLGRHITENALLIVITVRSDELTRDNELAQLLPLLVRESRIWRIHLNRFDRAAVGELVAGRYDLNNADLDRLVEHLWTRSEGNPFFVEELLQGLEEGLVLQASGELWRLGDLDQVSVPPLLHQVLDARLARLAPQTRSALQTASVIGQEVPFALWQTVTDLDDAQLDQAVVDALEMRLLEERPGTAAFHFRHALVREALYESILLRRRLVLHRQAAEALILTTNPDPDRVAHHLHQANDPRAVGWFIRAGERAERAHAWVTAADRFEMAARLLDDAQDAHGRGWLWHRAGQLHRHADPQQCLDDLERALEIAIQLNDQTLEAFVLTELGFVRCAVGEIEVGLAELDAGTARIEALGLEDHQRGAPRDRSNLALWLAGTGHHDRAIAVADAYLETLDQRDAPRAPYWWAMGWIHAARGNPAEARRAFARARHGIVSTGDFVNAGLASFPELTEVVVPYQADQFAERQRLADEIKHYWTEASGGLPRGWSADTIYCERWLLEGRWSEARELLMASRDHVHVQWREYVAGRIGWLARQQGGVDLAREQVQTVLPQGPDTEPGKCYFLYAVRLHRLAAELALDAGDLHLAREWIAAHDRWLEWARAVQGQAEAQMLWSRYHRLADDAKAARQHAERALKRASDPRQPLALLAAHRMLGELAIRDKRFAGAEEHLEESLTLAEACAAPFEQAQTLLVLAELSLNTGKPDEAWALLDKVRAICTPLKATRALRRAIDIAAKLSVRRGQPVYPAGLTPREVEVLQHVAQGMTNADVGDALFISSRTVAQHLRSVYNKLGVDSRVEATRFAVDRGLLDSPSA